MARTTSVTLGQHFEDFINDRIQEGHFQTVSEAIRAGMKLLERDYREQEVKLEVLRQKLEKGRNSPVVEDFDPEKLIEELKRKHG